MFFKQPDECSFHRAAFDLRKNIRDLQILSIEGKEISWYNKAGYMDLDDDTSENIQRVINRVS